ncbi:MAG: metallophosphoesterase [Flammeovirgaceae bacterium]
MKKFIAIVLNFCFLGSCRIGADFFVVGDFGWARDMQDPDMVFNAMNEVKMNAVPDSNDDAQFILSVGDNLYPMVDEAPTDEEFATVMTLFERAALKNTPVWAVRGNHDCYFEEDFEINKSKEYAQWNMPSLFYKKEV